jgi:hypothetical protein
MRFARFWARQTASASDPKGRTVRAAARGWSDESTVAAAAMAREIAGTVARLLAAGQSKLQRYQYGDRPIPEPVVREFSDGNGLRAAVTRNVYGALVLNTRDLMFVDVDVDEPKQKAGALFASVVNLFTKRPTVKSGAPDPIVERLRSIADAHDIGLRIYKTAGGFRGLVTSAAFDPGDAATRALFEEFGADPLYVRLCESQKSFRARMTPKPWRIDLGPPTVSYPCETPDRQSTYDAWQASYESASAKFAVCAFLTEVGADRNTGAFDDLIDFHDKTTGATTGLPLA